MAHQEQNSPAGYVVRLAETADALMAILKVRYEVMRVEFPMYVAENPIGIDIDQWDAQAHHLGLWKIEDGREEPVGYMRVIQTSPTIAGEEVFKIVKMFPTLEDRIKKTSNNPIKFLDKYQDFKEAKIKYDGFPNEKIMEGSRLAVKKECRELNPGRFLVETSFALFYNKDVFHHGFIEVRENHFPAYYRYGFRQVASIYVPQDGGCHILCYAHYTDLPGYLNEKMSTMREEFKRRREIVFRTQIQEARAYRTQAANKAPIE